MDHWQWNEIDLDKKSLSSSGQQSGCVPAHHTVLQTQRPEQIQPHLVPGAKSKAMILQCCKMGSLTQIMDTPTDEVAKTTDGQNPKFAESFSERLGGMYDK
ncbi:unnamed protein product [Citrullus colocynthis]|uniref:Uncharacterized protein n=1 Tax=Citrullus colocynthis TaxID=252529 RepID=A0ABP0YYA4_9ROSI